jgi:hypothetical protein
MKVPTKLEGKKRPDMITLAFADMMILGKEEEEIDDKANQWNLIIKAYGLKMNMDKTVTMRISKNLCTNVIIEVNNTMVKQGDIYLLGSKINSEW